MTETTNLGLPFIEGSQAQKHVTHNESLRILDAAIQIAVLDTDRTAPPLVPMEGDRHIVAVSPTGVWAGHAAEIAAWQDGAWRFLVSHTGWIAWSVDDDVLFVFDGAVWRDLSDLPTMFDHVGVNTSADTTNRLSVRSNAVLLTGIATGDGGSGDVRLQLSKQVAGNTASVVFSNAFSARAEFGLVGSDAFQLKVSPDGTSFTDAFVIDQATGNLTLPRALCLTGVISPSQITSNQNDYTPSGFSTASVVRLSTDASRDVTGLAAGASGRTVYVYNVGSFNVVLRTEHASSTAVNRFGFSADLTLASKQGATLIYDDMLSRWRQVGGPTGSGGGAGTITSIAPGAGLQNAGTTAAITSSGALSIDGAFGFRNRLINPNGAVWQRANSGAAAIADVTYAFDRWYGLTQTAGVTASQVTNAENSTPYMMRLSQANATAQRFGIAQAIESANCIDLRGQGVALSARVRMSVSTTLRYAIVEWTGTADTITKDIVNSWTSGTFTTGNFFISTTTTIVAAGSIALTANTLATISLTGTISGSANNLLVFFWTDSTQAQNVTLDVGKVQLEQGLQATPLAVRAHGQEISFCHRYYFRIYHNSIVARAVNFFGTTSNIGIPYKLPQTMRIIPTISNATVDINDGAETAADFTVVNDPGLVNIFKSASTGASVDLHGFEVSAEL